MRWPFTINRRMSRCLGVSCGSLVFRTARDTRHHILRDCGRDVDLALQRMANGGDELVAGRLLQQKAGRSSLNGVGRQVPVVMHRQHDHLAVDPLALETTEHVEAAEARHREVGDDDVRAKPYGGVDEALAIADGADDVKVRLLQDSREAIGDNPVVVGEEDGGASHHATCPSTAASIAGAGRAPTGIVACTRVPWFKSALDANRASRELCPLVDTHQSQTVASASGVQIEPAAIIRNRDVRVLTGVEHSNIGAAGGGMRDDVPQCFLRDPVDAERRVRSHGPEISLGGARHHHAVRTLEFATVRRQTLHEPQMLQHGRMEIVREVANTPCERERLLLELHQFLLQVLTDVIGLQPLLETTQRDGDTSQLLTDVVVQVPRDPCPLDILRLDQPASQVPNFSMTLPKRFLRYLCAR